MGSLKSSKVLLCLLATVVTLPFDYVDSLRTKSATPWRSRAGESRSRSASGMHPSPKERRLSFLNHQLSMLGGQFGQENRIASKIFSHLVDSATGTDEISIVDVPQNTDIVVGKEIPKGRRVVLECQAEFPVNWVYKGDGVGVKLFM